VRELIEVRSSRASLGVLKNEINDFVTSASFCLPELFIYSAWMEHAPFAFWLIDACRPGVLVELGAYTGYSYLAFAQAVKRLGTQTRCFAIDTWKGDEHAGFYGEDVFEKLRDYNDQRYSEFSRLIRSSFDDAVKHFDNGSIDLLHVDGRHFYEDVKHDFETWKPKLSERAVVLFHDTQIYENEFGVFQFWEEVKEQYPHFEFTHGHGLGVLGVGAAQSASLSELFERAEDSVATAEVRDIYSRLGAGLKDHFDLGRLRAEHEALRAEFTREREQLKSELLQVARQREQLEADLLQNRAELRQIREELVQQRAVLDQILSSISWRVTSPLRTIGRKLPRLKKGLKKVLFANSEQI
jgi:hypothetical protein